MWSLYHKISKSNIQRQKIPDVRNGAPCTKPRISYTESRKNNTEKYRESGIWVLSELGDGTANICRNISGSCQN